MTPSPPILATKLPGFLSFIGILLTAALTFVPHSATTVWDIRWLPLHLASMVLVLLGAALQPGAQRSTLSPMVNIALVLLALGWIGGALNGPFPHRALLYAFPGICACCIGVFWLSGKGHFELSTSQLLHRTLLSFTLLWCAVSLYRFLTTDILPYLQHLRRLDEAAGGGLYALILREDLLTLPNLRNSHPTGHPNYNSGFLLLLLPLSFHAFARARDRPTRILGGVALLAGVLVLFTLQSRNTFVGLVAGTFFLFLWARRGTLSFPRALFPVLAGIVLLAFALSPRLQQTLTESFSGRLGMWKAAVLTGLHYFPFGCGEGLTPEMLNLFSSQLPDRWPASMQFHQTWLHFWAVGGVLSAIGILLLSVWVLWALFQFGRISPDNRRQALPSVFALAATSCVMLADYQWDIFPITLLLLYHLSQLAQIFPRKSTAARHRWSLLLPALPCIALLVAAFSLPGALRSRNQIDLAGLAAENHDLPSAVVHFEKAFQFFPETYSLNMAGQLLARDPQTHREALRSFERSLALWDAQPVAHDFLAELWFRDSEQATPDSSDARNSLEKALHHARRLAEISPELGGAHQRVARFAQRLARPEIEIFDALTDDVLRRPDLLFPAIWSAQPEIAPLRDRFLEHFMGLPADPQQRKDDALGARQAWFVELGLVPNDSVNPDPEYRRRVSASRQQRTSFRLLETLCQSPENQRAEATRRLLIYLFRQPISLEAAQGFHHSLHDSPLPCDQAHLLAGQARFEASAFSGIGILARHPRSLPIPRMTPQINVLGERFLRP